MKQKNFSSSSRASGKEQKLTRKVSDIEVELAKSDFDPKFLTV